MDWVESSRRGSFVQGVQMNSWKAVVPEVGISSPIGNSGSTALRALPVAG